MQYAIALHQHNQAKHLETNHYALKVSLLAFFWIFILLLPAPALKAGCASCGSSYARPYGPSAYGSGETLPAYRVPTNHCGTCATCTGIPDSYRQSPECVREIPIPERGYRVYNCPQRKKHKIKVKARPTTVVTEYYCVEKQPKFKKCCPFPPRIIDCRTINPADLVDSTCVEFQQRLKTCQPYTCQAPSAQDPYVKSIWQIHQKVGNRCVVSNTVDTVGITDEDGVPLPITQVCEYDKIGVVALLKRFSDMQKEFYHFSTCENFRGVHNCTYHINGKVIKSIKDIRKPPY